jgi:hypothetical protein
MTLFSPAEVTSAYLKSGFLGFQGSGKSVTLSALAAGLVLHMKKLGIEYADKPVFFLDTETGSDWLIPLFKELGVPLHVAKTRAFSDLIAAIDEAKKDASFLIVDSVTHFWTELTSSYARAKAKQLKITSGIYRLQFQDWAFLKGDQGWQQFTDRYVNSPLHMGVAGRAGFEYDYFEDDDGKKQLEKTGVKMKAEGEFGFEPSLLVQMEIHQKLDGKSVERVWRKANVVKDRSMLIDGKSFLFTGTDDDGNKLSAYDLTLQTFRAFQPHISRLNLGGKQLGVDTSRTSEHMVPADKKDWNSTQKTIVLEEIDSVLTERYPSAKAEDKQAKAAMILKHFQTRSWTEVENMRTDELRERFDMLHRELFDGAPSRYTAINAENAKGDGRDLGDSLPDHSAAPQRGPGPRQDAAPPAELTLEQKLVAQIADCKAITECVHVAMEVTNKYREQLGEAGFIRINEVLMKRQSEILKEESDRKAKDGGDGGEKPQEPKDPKPAKNGRGGNAKRADVDEIDEKTGFPKGLVRNPDNTLPKAPTTVPEQSSADADLYSYAS